MPNKRSPAVRIAHAVLESDLPPDVRHLVLTLALLADGSTAQGWHSQRTIGRAMGISERHVRRLEIELAEAGQPVRLLRKRRGPRPSEWWLELAPVAADRTSSSDQDRTASSDQPTPRQDREVLLTGRNGTSDRTDLADNRSERSISEIDLRSPSATDEGGFALKSPERRAGSKNLSMDTDAALEVFEYWASMLWSKVHAVGHPERTQKRMGPIRARLAEGFTPEQLRLVTTNVAGAPFMLGENDSGRPYIEPETIFRNRTKVENWLVKRAPRRANGTPVQPSHGVIIDAEVIDG